MSTLYFDIEADGLLPTITKVHCMCIIENGNVSTYRPHEVHEGAIRLLQALKGGNYICGHNIINYDIPALEKIFKDFRVTRELRKYCLDTLVYARLLYGDIKTKDYDLYRAGKISGKLIGSQSLKAWGYRIGENKGDYGESEGAWENFTEEMLTYNVQDVVVTQKLYERLSQIPCSDEAIRLELQAQWLMSQQERNGFDFDSVKAEKLETTLRCRKALLDTELLKLLPQVPDKVFTPKRDNKRLGYKAGVSIQRYKDFNTNSRQQIEWLITEHFKYKPECERLYDNERLKINDETFAYLEEDDKAPNKLRVIAKLLVESLLVTKRLAQLADGTNAWLKMLQPDGKIHGSVNPCGTVTGRATHSYPNIAQVPSVSSPYGTECRELFRAPKGWYQAGIDCSGLELRCLAHFMYPYDNGAYAHEILTGDIHTANQHSAGLPTRNDAKRFIYAYLYGAGDELIGQLIGGGVSEGRKIKKEFLEKTPALASLRQAIQNSLVAEERYGKVTKWKRHYLKGLDGRKLPVRSIHSALNLLLQSAGAIICKRWIVVLEQRLLARGFVHGEDFMYMAWVHDEVQVACATKKIANIVVDEAQNAIRDVQKIYNIRVQLDTEGKIGANWADCH